MKLIDLSDKDIFDTYLKHTKCLDLGFGVLCAYMDIYTNGYEIFEDYLTVIPEFRQNAFSDLLGEYDEQSFERAVDIIFQERECAEFFCVPQEHVYRYEKLTNYTLSVTADYPNYMNEQQDFISLSWNKCKSKTADYNHFVQNNKNIEFQIIDRKNALDAKGIHSKWCSKRDCGGCAFGCEQISLANFISQMNTTGVSGGIVYVEGKAEGFMLCEQNCDTVYIYMAKTGSRINGLTVYLYIETMKHVFPNASYVNLGTTEGIKGLEHFKQKFKPYFFVERNTVFLTKN